MALRSAKMIPAEDLEKVLSEYKNKGLSWLWVEYSNGWDMVDVASADLPALTRDGGFLLRGSLFGEAGELQWTCQGNDVKLIVTWEDEAFRQELLDAGWSEPAALSSSSTRKFFLWGEPSEDGFVQQRVGKVALPLDVSDLTALPQAKVRVYKASSTSYWRLVGLKLKPNARGGHNGDG